ncbi:hypothetical protein [Halovivax limisalsi]|uniref:hypothetical protein n=1 Tax=Halovivax limisalsi TaxID=1453760 RepID=UPI001FFDD2C2|nr:hypothetical protein [Halovivax limisalsi]
MSGATLSRLGLVLVVVGALALSGPAFGFASLGADRGVGVTTADTETAMLSIYSTGETPDQHADADVIEIANNAGVTFETLDTEATIVDDPNGALAFTQNGFAATLAPGESTGLEMTCAGGGKGTATVSVTANATGPGLSITGVSYSRTFDYACTGGGGTGPVAFDASDLATSDTAQTFTFDGSALKNKDAVTIDVSALQDAGLVDYGNVTDADVTVVRGSARDVGFDPSTGELTYVQQGGGSGTVEIRLSNLNVLDSGSETVTYADDRGRSDSDRVTVGS